MLLRCALCAVIFALTFVGSNACGCHGCFYEEQSACARCCTAFIKRSGPPALSDRPIPDSDDRSLVELVRRLDSARFARPYRPLVQNYVNGDRDRRAFDLPTLFRRDTCGCSMGCFYEEPTECARCCSQSLRRNTYPNQRVQAEQDLADILDSLPDSDYGSPPTPSR